MSISDFGGIVKKSGNGCYKAQYFIQKANKYISLYIFQICCLTSCQCIHLFVERISRCKYRVFVNLAAESQFQRVPNLASELVDQDSQDKHSTAGGQHQGHPQVSFREQGGQDPGCEGEAGQKDSHKDGSQEAEVGPPLLGPFLHVVEVVQAQEEEAGEDRQEAAVEALGDFGHFLSVNCKVDALVGGNSLMLLTMINNWQSTGEKYYDLYQEAHSLCIRLLEASPLPPLLAPLPAPLHQEAQPAAGITRHIWSSLRVSGCFRVFLLAVSFWLVGISCHLLAGIFCSILVESFTCCCDDGPLSVGPFLLANSA